MRDIYGKDKADCKDVWRGHSNNISDCYGYCPHERKIWDPSYADKASLTSEYFRINFKTEKRWPAFRIMSLAISAKWTIYIKCRSGFG